MNVNIAVFGFDFIRNAVYSGRSLSAVVAGSGNVGNDCCIWGRSATMSP
jgi:hypothetical protein